MVDGHTTFASLKCAQPTNTQIGAYILIALLSASTALLGFRSVFSMLRDQTGGDDRKMTIYVSQLLFFLLSAGCSCMRVPVLHSLCEEPGESGAMKLYVAYASSYMLQWAMMLLVLSSRLHGMFEHTHFWSKQLQWYTALTACALAVALGAWTVNCVRLLTHNGELDAMNWFLGALSVALLLVGCKLVSCAFINSLYNFHLRFGCAEPPAHARADQLHPPGASVDLIALVTRLTILTALSTLSSTLMCVCVVLAGLLTADMSDSLLFALFCGHSVDVAGNCLAMYLAVNMGAAHFYQLCGSAQACLQNLCVAMARRARQREIAEEAAWRLQMTLELATTDDGVPDLAISASLQSQAAFRAGHNQRMSQRISRNLSHLQLTMHLAEPEAASASSNSERPSLAVMLEAAKRPSTATATATAAAHNPCELELESPESGHTGEPQVKLELPRDFPSEPQSQSYPI